MGDRQKRLVLLSQYLVSHPRSLSSLTEMSRHLKVAKSTLSEDLLLIKETLEREGLGKIESQVGVQGGIRYIPAIEREVVADALTLWCQKLGEPDRMMSDGFLYMTDLLFNPRWIDPMARLLAARFGGVGIEFVATVETKGIPLAMACAGALGCEVVLLRRDNRLSEGSSLSINYLSGSSHRIQSMSLSRRTSVRGGRVLFVDDFMKAGGTAKAAEDLLLEFDATVSGVGVLVATVEPSEKLVGPYSSCLEWDGTGKSAPIPSGWARSLCESGEVQD